MADTGVIYLDGTVCTIDLQGLLVAREHCRGGEQSANCAVLKLNRGGDNILDLDALVSDRAHCGGHGLDGAHDPAELIHVVNPLVHQCAPAVQVPRPPPAS